MKSKPIIISAACCFAILFALMGCIDEQNSKKNKLKDNMKQTWSGAPGDTSFSTADRLAIKSVMNAFSIYWDNHQLEKFISLFTDDAYLIWSQPGHLDTHFPVNLIKATAKKKFENNELFDIQQRHL